MREETKNWLRHKDKRINEFIKKVKSKYRTQKILLFGSRARDDYLEDSDFDFIIVSKDFENQNFLDRISGLMKKCDIYFNADILCHTPNEFDKKKKEIGTVGNAVKEGIEIA